MCPRRCRWVMDCWTFSPYGLFGVDYFPKALPLGYELLDFQPVWIVCPRRCRWVMDCWTFSPYGLYILVKNRLKAYSYECMFIAQWQRLG